MKKAYLLIPALLVLAALACSGTLTAIPSAPVYVCPTPIVIPPTPLPTLVPIPGYPTLVPVPDAAAAADRHPLRPPSTGSFLSRRCGVHPQPAVGAFALDHRLHDQFTRRTHGRRLGHRDQEPERQ